MADNYKFDSRHKYISVLCSFFFFINKSDRSNLVLEAKEKNEEEEEMPDMKKDVCFSHPFIIRSE